MNPFRSLTFVVLVCLIGCSNSSESHNIEESIPNGKLFTLSFKTSSDSGFVSTAIIETDTSIQCGSRRIEDDFPVKLEFDIKIWCVGSSDTLNYQYDGKQKIVNFGKQTFDVSESNLLIATMRNNGSDLYHITQVSANTLIPSETEKVLKEKFSELYQK